MAWITGGTFRIGSEKHYPEEAPAHRVTVDGIWIDHTPVTNREFRKFVNATRYITFADIAPDPKDYPECFQYAEGWLACLLPTEIRSRSSRLGTMLAVQVWR